MRIGIGFDAHPFAKERALIIGGVTIPFDKGLQGHSDADVLTHAIADAILGALAIGDIGLHFPPSNPKYKGISSLVLLQETVSMISQKGYVINNIDSVIIAEKPKMAPFIEQMRSLIAKSSETSIENVSIKATTTEMMGFTGRGEGIAAQAVVSLTKKSIG